MLRLYYKDGDDEVAVDLAPGVYFVGRAEESDIVLRDPSVSSKHLRLDVQEDGSIDFRDLMSSNGTRFHGRRTDAGRLAHNDRLRIGRVKVRIADPERPTPPVLSAPTPPDDDEPGTPVNPMPPATLAAADSAPPRALMVMPAAPTAASAADAKSAPDADALRKKRIRLAAIGGGAFLLLIILLLGGKKPAQGPRDQPPDKSWSYPTEVENGIRAYQRREYAAARETWEKAAAEAARRNMTHRDSARAFAEVLRDLQQFARHADPEKVQWNAHIRSLENVHKNERNVRDFTVELTQQLGREHANANQLTEARAHLRAEDFPAAVRALDKIGNDSVLRPRVADLRQEIDRRTVDALNRRLAVAESQGDFQAVYDLVRELRVHRPDDKNLAEKLAMAQSNISREKLEQDFLAAGRVPWPNTPAEHDAAIHRLREAVDNLYRAFPAEYAESRRLPQVRDAYLDRIFRHETAKLFHAWDQKKLAEALKDRRSDHVDLAAVRQAHDAAMENQQRYADALKRTDIEAAQRAVRAILAIDLLHDGHPLRQWAQALRLTPTQTAHEMLNAASELVTQGEFAEARWNITRAKRLLRLKDPTELVAKLNEYRRELALLNGQRDAQRRNADKRAEVEARIEALEEENADLKAEAEKQRQFLDLRDSLLKRSRQFLSAGRKADGRVGDFQKARDCVAYPNDDSEVRTQFDNVEREYRRKFNRAMPAMSARAEPADDEEAEERPPDDEP